MSEIPLVEPYPTILFLTARMTLFLLATLGLFLVPRWPARRLAPMLAVVLTLILLQVDVLSAPLSANGVPLSSMNGFMSGGVRVPMVLVWGVLLLLGSLGVVTRSVARIVALAGIALALYATWDLSVPRTVNPQGGWSAFDMHPFSQIADPAVWSAAPIVNVTLLFLAAWILYALVIFRWRRGPASLPRSAPVVLLAMVVAWPVLEEGSGIRIFEIYEDLLVAEVTMPGDGALTFSSRPMFLDDVIVGIHSALVSLLFLLILAGLWHLWRMRAMEVTRAGDAFDEES